jgi:hypothetical protein
MTAYESDLTPANINQKPGRQHIYITKFLRQLPKDARKLIDDLDQGVPAGGMPRPYLPIARHLRNTTPARRDGGYRAWRSGTPRQAPRSA